MNTFQHECDYKMGILAHTGIIILLYLLDMIGTENLQILVR